MAYEAGIVLFGLTVIGLSIRNKYPDNEEFVITEPRSIQFIQRAGTECRLYTTVLLESERREKHEFYSLLLRDYMARRGCDTLLLMPREQLPKSVIHGDTFIVELDSCATGKIAYRTKE